MRANQSDRALAELLSHGVDRDGKGMSHCNECGWQRDWTGEPREEFWALHGRHHREAKP